MKMPTVVMASPKGGSGKSTCALLLATELAYQGRTVTLIEAADPNHPRLPPRPLAKWAAQGHAPANIRIVDDVSVQTMNDMTEGAVEDNSFVIVDLDSGAPEMFSDAVSRADLVIIPSRASDLDAFGTCAALREVDRIEKDRGIKINAAVLFTQTNPAIRDRPQIALERIFERNQITVMNCSLREAEAYRAMFAFALPLRDLDEAQACNIPAAIKNAEVFAAEVCTWSIAPLQSRRLPQDRTHT
jgi:chromosome partitioning protein